MTKEDFYKVWKDSSREDILNQYYYDYKCLRKWGDDINKAITFIIYNSFKFTYYEEDDEGRIDFYNSEYRVKQLTPAKVRQLLDILKGSDKE